jgi:hypothetical protein
MVTTFRLIISLTAILSFTILSACADVITTSERGWYRDDGVHETANDNYVTGEIAVLAYNEYRSFFVFDVPTQTEPIRGGVLRLFNPSSTAPEPYTNGYLSTDLTETLTLFDVSTPTSTLVDGTGGLSAFEDLGTGNIFGQLVVNRDMNGSFIEVALNSAGLSALDAAQGGTFVIGAALITLDLGISPITLLREPEYVFGNTGNINNIPSDGATSLLIAAVPEPSSLIVLSPFALLILRRRRSAEGSRNRIASSVCSSSP